MRCSQNRWNWPILLCVATAIDCGFDPFADAPPAGNPQGLCIVPPEAEAEDTSHPDQVVGDGSPASCTSEAFVSAVAAGGVITFNCGLTPATITLERTATIVGPTGRRVVIDGGGTVALSGGGHHRILYVNSCDPAHGWSTSDCAALGGAQLTLQNLTFVDGSARGLRPGGGGALFVAGAKLKVVNSRFFRNFCDDDHWDGGGGAIRIESLSRHQPVYVVGSTFGGRSDVGNVGSNGGALSTHNVASIMVLNSVLSDNAARPYIQSAGGGLYDLDGDLLSLCGVQMANNRADHGPGGAVFFGANGSQGVLSIIGSTLRNNPSESKPILAGIAGHAQIVVRDSTIE